MSFESLSSGRLHGIFLTQAHERLKTHIMQDYRKLMVWGKSHKLALEIYKATANFPRSEAFGLTSQLRRAAVSIPSNIAEGCGRGSTPDFIRFLHIAKGSASETDYQLLLSRDLGYIEQDVYVTLSTHADEVSRMLHALIQKLNKQTV